MNRLVRVHGPSDVRVDDIGEPRPGARDVVVDVAACGVCGTDLGYVRMGGLIGPGPEPMALGHEISGTIGWVGDDADGWSVGDRVVVHPGDDELGRIGNGAPEGGLTHRLLVREAARGGRLHRVPDAVPLDVAALAEPLAVGMRAVDQSGATRGDRVAVFGCGPIGMMAVAVLVDRGVEDVVAVDLSETRLRLAASLGAHPVHAADESVWSVLAERHGTTPFLLGPAPSTDAFIEASGAASVIGDVVDHARPGSTLSIVALHRDPVPTNYLMVLMKQLTIRGSMEYPPRFADSLDLLARSDLSDLITHRFPLDRATEAIDLLDGSTDCGKVLVTMGDALSNQVAFDFAGAQVLVTGGTSGIGHVIGRAFADAGATVTVTGTRPSSRDYDTDLTGLAYHELDVREPASIERLVDGLDRLDVLVNNAGATFPGGRDEWEPDAFAASLDLNLAGPMRLASACRPLLAASGLDGGGSVVGLASMAAFRAEPIIPGYGSAKAGLVTLTHNLAVAWADEGIRVNAVAPGLIDTPMTAPMSSMPELLDAQIAKIPMRRTGAATEVAPTVLFLCSGAASYVTGTVWPVDGGWLAR